MKLVIALLAAAVISSGCATTVTATVYDPLEYGNFVQTWTAAEIIRTKCEYPSEVKILALQLKVQSLYALNYSSLGADKEVAQSAKIVYDNVKELSDKYFNELNAPSKKYCELKTDLIVSQTKRLADTVKRKQ